MSNDDNAFVGLSPPPHVQPQPDSCLSPRTPRSWVVRGVGICRWLVALGVCVLVGPGLVGSYAWSVHSTQGFVARFCCFRLLVAGFCLPCVLFVCRRSLSMLFLRPRRLFCAHPRPWWSTGPLAREELLANRCFVRRRVCLRLVVCFCLFVFGSRAGIPADVFALDALLGSFCWVSALLLSSLWLASFACVECPSGPVECFALPASNSYFTVEFFNFSSSNVTDHLRPNS